MKLFLLFFSVVHCYIITSNIDGYVRNCNGNYVREISYDISKTASEINEILDNFYTKEILTKAKLNDIIVIEHSDDFSGLFCSPSTIVITIDTKNNMEKTLHHEIMHMIDYASSKSHRDDWNALNKFGYVGEEYSTTELRQGFITKYGMRNADEDIATTYEEFAIRAYSRNKNIYYDKTIIEKFKLLFRKIISFHEDFKGIVERRNTEENYIYPVFDRENTINIRFRTYSCNGVRDSSIILFNIVQLRTTYENIVGENITQWMMRYSKNDNRGIADKDKHMLSSMTCVRVHGYGDRDNYINHAKGDVYEVLYYLDYYNIKYIVKFDVNYEELHVPSGSYLSGLITLQY